MAPPIISPAVLGSTAKPFFLDVAAVFGAPDFTSDTFNITSGYISANHGLGAGQDLFVQLELVCATAGDGYAVGDTLTIHQATLPNYVGGIGMGDDQFGYNDTEVFATIAFRRYDIVSLATGNRITSTNFDLRFKVWILSPTFTSGDITPLPSSNVATTAAHGLGAGNYYVIVEYECVIAEDNWRFGDKITHNVAVVFNTSGNFVRGELIYYDSTNVGVVTANENYMNRTTGQNAGQPTDANWECRFKVYELPTNPSVVFDATTMAAGTAVSFDHSLTHIHWSMYHYVCNTAEDNWAVGDRIVSFSTIWDNSANTGSYSGNVGVTNSEVIVHSPSDNTQILLDKTSPNNTIQNLITYANWDILMSIWGEDNERHFTLRNAEYESVSSYYTKFSYNWIIF
jgi:hypothetical protein